MAFEAIFEGIMALLRNDPLLVPGILGPKTVQNQRLYRVNPQMQSYLTTYEPNQPSEGWIVVEEPEPSMRLAARQFGTNHEFLDLVFHVYATTYALGHQVMDVLDTYLHWEISQQHSIQWGERIVLFSRRYTESDKYQASIKLVEKQITYALELVRDVALE